MDRHDIDGLTAQSLADAHDKDLKVQDKYGANYMTYWHDEARGHVFCLCDAPSKEIAVQVHRESHGLVPHEIIEVDRTTVEAFLGSIEEPTSSLSITPVLTTEPQSENPFRTILFTDLAGSTAFTRELGDAKAMVLLRTHNAIVREAVRAHGGREVKHTGDGFMVAFASVSLAVQCAIAILRAFEGYNIQNPDAALHLRIGLSAGEPVAEDEDLFGATVQLAARLCDCAKNDSILVASVVRDLCLGKKLPFIDEGERSLKGFDRPVRVYTVQWLDAS